MGANPPYGIKNESGPAHPHKTGDGRGHNHTTC
uniref:Uncharacterized protein n=1 Tax=Myoviridae sp. ctw4b6 TaxID=2825206 RepID=A0A8S5QC14_9CAUD|nr:MAG TPA: hypothetical protein [Myoviridae sp. ctw4b6]